MMSIMKTLSYILIVLCVISSKTVMASGYIPVISEIADFIYHLKNPEPHSTDVGLYWTTAKIDLTSPLLISKTTEGESIYLCTIKDNNGIGFTSSSNGPCYIAYKDKKFVTPQAHAQDLLIFAPESAQYYVSNEDFIWQKPLHEARQGDQNFNIALFDTKNIGTEYVVLCKTKVKGILYFGFVMVNESFKSFNKTVASGNAICNYRYLIEDHNIYKAPASEILYMIWPKF